MKPIIIGICGPSGSGKSTVARALSEELNCDVFCADRYFKSELPKMISPDDGNEYPDWNSLESINYQALADDVMAYVEKSDKKHLIVEGSLIFAVELINSILDLRIFVTATPETCIYRRIVRNITLMGQSAEYIGSYYLKCARHREAQFCLPNISKADIVIDNDVSFENDLKAAVERINLL